MIIFNAIVVLRPMSLTELLYILLVINSAYNRAEVEILLYCITLNELAKTLAKEFKKFNIITAAQIFTKSGPGHKPTN